MSTGKPGTGPIIDTVIVVSERPEELAEFYRRGLGLGEPERYGDDHIGFSLPGVYLGFDRAASSPVGNSVTAWFRVDDVVAAFKRLVALGAKIGYPPTEKPWGDRLASVVDPDGNRIGLAQRRR